MAYARELEISYGSLTVGGDSTLYLLTDWHQIRHGFLTTEVEFTFVVVAEDEAEFESACAAVEAECRKPDQDVIIRQGAATLLALKQSDNTGLDAMPTIAKAGDENDTGRSRTYTVRVELGRPGTRAGYDGLRRSSVAVSYSPSRRRTVTIEGEFTAHESNAARAQYEDEIDALATAVTTALGGTYELAEESATNTTNDKSLSFRRVYDEVIYAQGPGGVGDAAIVRQTFNLDSTEQNEAGESPDALPLRIATVSYQAWIDKDESTDLKGKYESLKSWLIAKASALIGSGIVLSLSPRYDYDDNRISVSMRIGAATRDMIRYRFDVTDTFEPGWVLVPVWMEGDKYARYKYQGPARYTRTVTEEARRKGKSKIVELGDRHYGVVEEAQGDALFVRGGGVVRGGEWVIVSRTLSVVPVRLGVESELDVTDTRATTVLERINAIGSSSGGGTLPGGATTGGPPSSGAVTG